MITKSQAREEIVFHHDRVTMPDGSCRMVRRDGRMTTRPGGQWQIPVRIGRAQDWIFSDEAACWHEARQCPRCAAWSPPYDIPAAVALPAVPDDIPEALALPEALAEDDPWAGVAELMSAMAEL